jgi:hypothetical protein
MAKKFSSYLKLILAFLAILAGILFISQRTNVFPVNDYIEYWSASRLNFHGSNPYAPEEMHRLQQQIDPALKEPIMMWNPPWLLGFIMGFGLITFSTSRLLWFLCELFAIFISADWLWYVYNGNPKKRWIAWIAILGFGPTLHALKLGQITPFILLGIAGFLYFQKNDKPFWAGFMSSLILLKPQLLYLFVIAVLLWSLIHKKWPLLVGMAVGILIPFFIASLLNPGLTSQYLNALLNYPPEYWQTATLGTPLRLLFGQNLFFLQFIPMLLGLGWFLVYWFHNNKRWDWFSATPWIILVSTTTSAYGWVFDVIVVSVAVIQVASVFDFNTWTFRSGIIFVSFWAISLFNTFMSLPQHWFWWLSSYYLVWYICANYWIIKPNLNCVHCPSSFVKREA